MRVAAVLRACAVPAVLLAMLEVWLRAHGASDALAPPSAALQAFAGALRDGSLWQATLYLPLKKGRNELVLAVSEVFGGWGLMGRLEENPSPAARLATATAPREDTLRE